MVIVEGNAPMRSDPAKPGTFDGMHELVATKRMEKNALHCPSVSIAPGPDHEDLEENCGTVEFVEPYERRSPGFSRALKTFFLRDDTIVVELLEEKDPAGVEEREEAL